MRAEQRRIQIERANKILFDETDRVKTLHGKMLQCDAIKENEALISIKKQASNHSCTQHSDAVTASQPRLCVGSACWGKLGIAPWLKYVLILVPVRAHGEGTAQEERRAQKSTHTH